MELLYSSHALVVADSLGWSGLQGSNIRRLCYQNRSSGLMAHTKHYPVIVLQPTTITLSPIRSMFQNCCQLAHKAIPPARLCQTSFAFRSAARTRPSPTRPGPALSSVTLAAKANRDQAEKSYRKMVRGMDLFDAQRDFIGGIHSSFKCLGSAPTTLLSATRWSNVANAPPLLTASASR